MHCQTEFSWYCLVLTHFLKLHLERVYSQFLFSQVFFSFLRTGQALEYLKVEGLDFFDRAFVSVLWCC
jgi:hypothetical protein